MLDQRTSIHWLAIVDDGDQAAALIDATRADGDEVIEPIPKSALDVDPEAEIWARSDNAGPRLPLGEPPPFMVRSSGRTPLQCVVLQSTDDNGQRQLASAFPFAVAGSRVPLEIRSVTPLADGAGAIITADYQGAELTFCDPIFYKDKSRLRIGATAQFTLAAIAFWVDPVSDENLAAWDVSADITLIQPDRPGQEDETVEPDWQRFYGTVKGVDHAELDGRPILILDVPVVDGEPDLILSVYAAPKALADGFDPRPGDLVTGAAWVSGYLAGSWTHMPGGLLSYFSRI